MLNFRQYLKVINGEWLKEWNEMAISYGLTEFMNEDVSVNESVSIADQIKVLQKDMFPKITTIPALKDYLHKAGDVLGIEFNKDMLQSKPKRIAMPAEWTTDDIEVSAEKFRDFLNKVLPVKTKIVEPNDSVDGLKNGSTAFMGFVIDFDAKNEYPTSKSMKYLIQLAGNQKRSAGTAYQESGFLFALAASFKYEGDDIFNLAYWKSDDCRGKILVDGKQYREDQVEKIYNFSVGVDWKVSIRNAAIALNKQLKKKAPKTYYKDSAKFFMNEIAKGLYEREKWPTAWNNDKWNPADVWFSYSDNVEEKAKSFNSIIDLNGYLKESVENSTGIIGLSLKKFEKGGDVEVIDIGKKLKTVDSFEIVLGALFTQGINQNFVLSVPGSNEPDKVHSISYRLFQSGAKELIRGEVVKKGTEASHGKVFLSYIDYAAGSNTITKIVNKVRGDGNIEYKNGKYVLTDKGKKRFRLTSLMYRTNVKRSTVVSRSVSALTKSKPELVKEYEVFDWSRFDEGVVTFEDRMNDYIDSKFSNKSATQVINGMSVKLNATFQNVVFAGWWSVLAKRRTKKFEEANLVAQKMLYFGLSMADFSAVHLKIGG